ncbi:MAG: DUF92 domain-containing protein [Gemmatimonadota bacterium]
MTLPTRFLFGLALAIAWALAARRARVLSASGAWSAVAVGTVTFMAGWSWMAVLLTFFVSSSLLSRWRRQTKERATLAVVEKGGERDAWQVLANGGIFALCALGTTLLPCSSWALAGLGALAGATADTWATEVGTAIGGMPRALLSGRPVPAGTSGAVTVAGTAAMLAGALFLGTTAVFAGFGKEVLVPVAVGGVAGAVIDTLLGATMQERRWCARCEQGTERLVHDCGAETTHRRGWAGLDNDVVNLTSCVAGAAVALLCGR